jgi:hypothetical protein
VRDWLIGPASGRRGKPRRLAYALHTLAELVPRDDVIIHRNWSSLKERGRVKGGVFRSWRLDWACVDGVSCFPDSCHVRGERPVGSRTGRSPAAGGGAGGVLEVTGWEPDDLAAGERGAGGRAGSVRLFRFVPCSGLSGAGSAAGCSHPFAWPRPEPGGMGRVRVRGRSGGVNQMGARAAGSRRRGRLVGDLAPGRGGGLFMRPAVSGPGAGLRGAATGSGSARRASRRRPG